MPNSPDQTTDGGLERDSVIFPWRYADLIDWTHYAGLYFWLGEEAERIGFTLWQTAWAAYPTTMIGASDGRPYLINDYELWEHADGN